MSKRSTDSQHAPTAAPGKDHASSDEALIRRIAQGDPEAMRTLMRRYDRLVRYTIWRVSRQQCARDPQWLDDLASTTWAGFARSMRNRPDVLPRSVGTYLIQTARNRCASALRLQSNEMSSSGDSPSEAIAVVSSEDAPPEEMASRLELLEILKSCAESLEEADKCLLVELESITLRKWVEAAQRLGMSESTLRSKWNRTLSRLRQCMEKKLGPVFAPEPGKRDSSSETARSARSQSARSQSMDKWP